LKTCKADLSGAHRRLAVLVETNLENAVLTGCRVYAISSAETLSAGGDPFGRDG